ncbi:MAG: MFS transporter [Gammaproteobacteria bacterium]
MSVSQTAGNAQRAAGSPRVRLTLGLCAAAALLEGFDNQSMGVAAPRLFLEFSIAPSQGGIIFSAATFGLLFGALIGGRMSDYLGRRQTLTISLWLFGVCSLLTSVAHSAQMVLISRLLTGFGCGGAMPAFISMASEAVTSSRRLSAVTLVMAALPFGGALAGVMALGDLLGWGWRSIFIVGGAIPIAVASAIPVLFRGSPESERRAPPRPSRALPPQGVSAVLWGERRAGTTALLWCGFFFTQLILFLMLNWLPSLIVGMGFSRSEASVTSIGFNLAGGLGAVLLARCHAGARRRLWVVTTYGGIAAALLGLTALASVGRAFPAALIASAVAGVFIVGAQLILFALAPLYYPNDGRGTGVGVAVAVGRLGSVLGPLYASTLLAAGGSSAAVLAAIVPFVLLGGAAALGLTWRPQASNEQRSPSAAEAP